MSSPQQIANDNREIMGFLPPPLSGDLFKVGYQIAADFFSSVQAAHPKPTVDESLVWIGAARKDAHDQAVRFLWRRVIGGHEGFEQNLEWAAERIANEGFETFFKEALQ